MPDADLRWAEMSAVQHNLDLAVTRQRAAHAELIRASIDTQHWRDILARLEQQAGANKVVYRT